ncbi:90e66490-fbfb-4d2c-aeb5-016f3445fcd3 [Sclerotinia trifoliorum]|uniref:90e66490-fbfb-4d2c-aeb5-016f3445fcd3 n=1 Tax=Sclerotinia trifoliorum TaxID=28548 RepID=A0A8H2W1Y1_9HELO|nr:90e66490-fbfb-4d2c-aeb5-016f3445fcd3 [Sclerotinia trifoliorum]
MSFFTRSLHKLPKVSKASSANNLIFHSINKRSFHQSIANMGVHNLATATEFKSALTDNNIVVLDAFATWCGPCKAIAPRVAKFSEDYPAAHFVKIDVDELPDVAQELGIRAMPTFLIFKGEEKIAEVVGANPAALEQAIQKALAGEEST